MVAPLKPGIARVDPRDPDDVEARASELAVPPRALTAAIVDVGTRVADLRHHLEDAMANDPGKLPPPQPPSPTSKPVENDAPDPNIGREISRPGPDRAVTGPDVPPAGMGQGGQLPHEGPGQRPRDPTVEPRRRRDEPSQ